jgi:hypothetical protein
MAKKKATSEDFLRKMSRPMGEQAAPVGPPVPASPPEKAKGRAGLKHIGGYFDRETVEQVAVLRARLDLDNSQLLKLAIEELFNREVAARKFGDR